MENFDGLDFNISITSDGEKPLKTQETKTGWDAEETESLNPVIQKSVNSMSSEQFAKSDG